MMNTVLLSGKGDVVNMVFSILKQHYPDAVWKTTLPKWYQRDVRHEFRIPNMQYQHILNLQNKFLTEGFVNIHMEIF